MMNTILLSRIQFAFTISFHILFPAFSIGLATFLLIMETAWLKTKNPLFLKICKFWMKVFALTFGMGVVSGIVMEFQLGTNWSGFTSVVGPVLGSLFTYEVLTAFFIEAGFLGVMIFGWKKVGPRLHYLSTLLVTFGVTLSAFWILAANSWMQTPSGAILKHHHFVVQNWENVIFNHSTTVRYLHMMLSSYLATALVISGVSAYYLLKKIHFSFAKTCFSFATLAIVILIPLQIYVGDEVGLHVHEYQPIKTAAIEGAWKTEKGAPLLLFAIPDQKAQKNLFEIGIPHLASIINTHKWNGKIIGLQSTSRQNQPTVWVVFYTFRIMVALGFLMLLMGIISLYMRFRKKLYDTAWFLKASILCSPIGFIAILTGWFTAEIGRQPWVVYNIIRTKDAATPVTPGQVLFSLALLITVYGVIFGGFYLRYLKKIFITGPKYTRNNENTPFSYMQSGEVHDKR